ncbi:hypothetical protein JTB14_014399 [Gonioctena quinquepunctata]|nr:hypothetical protein JTB14_014399 [Gonioctena quinquepunctata]
MVDRQFSQKNGVAVIQSPALSPTREPKWVSPEIEQEQKKKNFQFDDHMPTMERMVLCLSEAGGTAILVFLGCMGCSRGMTDADIPVGYIALTFGLAIMIGVQIFGHISGAHLNPAVTTAAATLGHLPLIQVPIYLFGQILGALGGFGLLKALTPSNRFKFANATVGLCSPSPNEHMSSFQVVLVEFILTLILVWACCSVWDSRNKSNTDSVPLRLGLTITGLALAGGPYTGAHMNPARTFGPAVINGDWDIHWTYWLGPIAAGFVGGLVYRVIFSKDHPKSEADSEVPSSLEKT